MADGEHRQGNGRKAAAQRPLKLRDFSQSLPMTLLRAREAVMRHFRPALRHFGITEQQWRILRALASVDEIEVMALADATFLLPPSLSRILKDLEQRDLILRRGSDEDLRRGIVAIGPKGQALIDNAGQISEAIYREITSRFGAGKLGALLDALHDLEATLGAAPALTETLNLGPQPEDASELPRRGRPPKKARPPLHGKRTGA
jgi:homoprotocatechuate degradation regulator HpaR